MTPTRSTTPRMSARTADGTAISVHMIPFEPVGGMAGGRAILSCDEARALRDALSAALEIDDLRRAADAARARLDARLAA